MALYTEGTLDKMSREIIGIALSLQKKLKHTTL